MRESGIVSDAVDLLGEPMILVGPDLQVRHMNRSARQIAEDGRLLSVARGRLTVADPAAQAKLSEVVSRVLAEPPVEGAAAIALGADKTCPLHLAVVPVAQAGGGLAMILASPPTAGQASRAAWLRSLYGLSPGEATLAVMLADGRSLADMAEMRGVSVGTVRVQVKRIAVKLGCRRQSEIVRKVADLPRLHGG